MKASIWFDRAVSVFAPGLALGRVRNRIRFEATVRAYDGAARGRHTEGWTTPGTSADAEIAKAGPVLRDRARDLRRNNPMIAKGVSSWVTNLVGDGIMPRPNTGDDAKNQKVKDAFARWCDECDADGQLDFYGLQALAVGGMVESGEMLVRRRWRRRGDGYRIPMQIQLLEPDFIDSSIQGDRAGGMAVQGVQFDAIGRRSAYWLYGQHPGASVLTTKARLQSTAIPADDIVHLYEKTRTQVRGVTWLAPVIRSSRDHDDYWFAESVRKKTEASLVGVVIGEDDADTGINPKTGEPSQPGVVDGDGNLVESISPGMFAYARGGKEIRFTQPASTGGFAETDAAANRRIAAGLRMPYELLTGDMSQVNFTSMRAGLIEFRRLVSMLQWHTIIHPGLSRIWKWFCLAAYTAGEIDSPDIPVEWSPPAFTWVDPYKEVLADVMAIRAGIKTPQDVIGATGRTMQEVLAALAEWNTMLDELELTLDTDPRRTTLKGLMQKSATEELIG
ncbi:phage portal protein, partial [Rhodoplanes roseus]|uniref:phage portal protein n=1 Tax=Rhodoplanes roseus TaxID=29409 RepID=UPI000DAB7CCB